MIEREQRTLGAVDDLVTGSVTCTIDRADDFYRLEFHLDSVAKVEQGILATPGETRAEPESSEIHT